MKSPVLKDFGIKSLIGTINHKFSGGESTKPLGEGWHFKKRKIMKFNQHVLLKHDHGITAQWVSEDWSWMAVATYQQNEIKGKNTDGEDVVIKKWALTNCSGPWTGVSEDGKSLVIIPGYEAERNNIAGEANVLLTCFNAYAGGAAAIESLWKGGEYGLLDDEEMFVND